MKKLPPIWVINLDRSPARRKFMQIQLDALNVDYEFFPASDGQNLSWQELFRYSPIRTLWTEGRFLARNEIGCAISHARIYERIIAEQHDVVLVLEDDVVLRPDLFAIVQARNKFPDDWDLINFLSDGTRKRAESATRILDRYAICEFAQDANRTSAYLLRFRGAEKLLDHIYPIRYPADGLQGRAHITGLNMYGILPQPVSLADLKSDIWEEDSQPLWNKPIWGFTRKRVREVKRLLHRIRRRIPQ